MKSSTDSVVVHTALQHGYNSLQLSHCGRVANAHACSARCDGLAPPLSTEFLRLVSQIDTVSCTEELKMVSVTLQEYGDQ